MLRQLPDLLRKFSAVVSVPSSVRTIHLWGSPLLEADSCLNLEYVLVQAMSHRIEPAGNSYVRPGHTAQHSEHLVAVTRLPSNLVRKL
jgi:hypothetical protein